MQKRKTFKDRVAEMAEKMQEIKGEKIKDGKRIKKVIVTYKDTYRFLFFFRRHTRKTFTPMNWELFGERIKKIAKNVKIVYKK